MTPSRTAFWPLPAVVLSSQDIYQATTGLRTGRDVTAVALDEGTPVRTQRHPYRGLGLPGIPEHYEKLDVEERWLAHDAHGPATPPRLPA